MYISIKLCAFLLVTGVEGPLYLFHAVACRVDAVVVNLGGLGPSANYEGRSTGWGPLFGNLDRRKFVKVGPLV